MTDCPAPPTSLPWPDPADLPSTTSAGSAVSSQRKHYNWTKRWSPTAWTAASPSCLDSVPLWLNHCSISRTLQHASFSIYPDSPMWPPLASCPTIIRFKMMVLAFKTISRAAPVYLQTLVRPQAPYIFYIGWPAGNAIAESKQSPLS